MFADLQQLTVLDLTNNRISNMEPHVFDDSAHLPSLSRIFLSDNLLTELQPWPLIRVQNREISISLKRNRIANFTNALRWRFDCNSTRPGLSYLDLANNDVEHITDILHGWNIDGTLLTDYKSVF